MTQDTDPNLIRVPLKVVDAAPSGEGPFTKLAVVFESQRVQSPASGGLSFRLIVSNGSSEALKVQSPLEALQISLLDGKGWPLRLPPGTPPRSLINYRGAFKVIRPYQVVEIRDTGSDKDLLSTVDDLNWTLPEEGALRIGIKIDRLLPGGSREPASQATPIPIPEGAYQLKLIVPLISASSEHAHRVFNTDYIGLKLGVE